MRLWCQQPLLGGVRAPRRPPKADDIWSMFDRADLTRYLRQTEEHVALGARHLAEQRARVENFERRGVECIDSRKLVRLFEEMQALHVEHRDRLRRELEALGA